MRSIYNSKEGAFHLKKRPIYSQIVLDDEINRASPKTQSSLLEVMQENQITIDRRTYPMDEPFMIIATQNPVEYEGTFPLPEAQLDRFMMKVSLGYPAKEEEINIIRRKDMEKRLENLQPVVGPEDIIRARNEAESLYVKEEIEEYMIHMIRATRNDDRVLLGCSPRAAIVLYKAWKAYALIQGRKYVIPEDVKAMVPDVLSHRIILKPEAKYKGLTNQRFMKEIIENVGVSMVKAYE